MTALFKNYYVILGIRTDSTQEEIKKAYRTLASVYHPDKNKAPDAEEKFKEVKEAYDNLYDKIRRAIYDKKIVNFIENITLPEKYKDTLHSKCVQFVTKFRTKQEIGSLFDFKKFNITPGMITDIYDNVFCFKSGKYDDRLIGDDASPYSYVEYCGQHIAGNTAQQDMKRNVNKKAMSCNSKEPRYIFLFERKNDGFFYFCGLYKTDNHEIKNDRLVLYFKAVNLNIAASEKFTGKVLTTTHWNRLTTSMIIQQLGYDQEKWKQEFKNTTTFGKDKKLNPAFPKLWKAFCEAKNKMTDALGRTNQVLGEFAEKIASVYYGGELHKANHEGSDLKTPDGKEVQVKSRQMEKINFSTTLSFSNLKFDELLYIIFHANGEVIQAAKTSKEYVEEHGTKNNAQKTSLIVDTNSTRIPMIKDITDAIRKIIDDEEVNG